MMLIWLKFVHVGAIALWSAGLIALPFLFAQRGQLAGHPLFRIHAFTRSLYVAVTSPAAFVAIGSGTALILAQETYGNWFAAKLAMVAAMTGIHIFAGLMILRLFEPGGTYPGWRLPVMVPLTLLVVGTILLLVLGKPRLDVPSELMGMFRPGALGDFAKPIIDGWR